MKEDRYYTESYLHRMFINDNPILSQGQSMSMGIEAVKEKITKEAKALQAAEKNYLISLYQALTGDETSSGDKAEGKGMAILEALNESAKQVNGLISKAMLDVYFKTKAKTVDEVQKEMVSAIQKNIRGAKTSAGQLLNQRMGEYQEAINTIARNAAEAKVLGQRYMSKVAGIQGTKMENIMKNLILTKWSQEYNLKGVGKKLMVTTIGKTPGGAQYVDVDSVPDIDIKIDDKDFKFSQKTKVSRYRKVGILKGKSLGDLLEEGGQKSCSDFVKFGLINQHYWGDPEYQRKVIDAWEGQIPTEINPSGTSSTGIEQMSYISTMSVFHPIIDALYSSFALNLFLGFKKEDPNLFTVVVGNPFAAYQGWEDKDPTLTRGVKGTILRSSDVLNGLAASLDTGKSRLAFSSSFEPNTTIVNDAWSEEYRDHRTWKNYIEGKFDNILEKTKITTTYNYGRLN